MASLFHTLLDGIQKGAGIPPDEAERIAVAVIEWGAETGAAGVEFYWPARAGAMTLAQRNEAIRTEFNGRNLKAVCQKYQVSKTTVYRVLGN